MCLINEENGAPKCGYERLARRLCYAKAMGLCTAQYKNTVRSSHNVELARLKKKKVEKRMKIILAVS